MLSGQGVDPTSLLRRREGVVVSVLCNLHRLQLIVFTSDTGQHTKCIRNHNS